MPRKKIEYGSGVKIDFTIYEEGIFVDGRGFMTLQQVDELIDDLKSARDDYETEAARVSMNNTRRSLGMDEV